MKSLSKQRGWIAFPDLRGLFVFALIGLVATVWGVCKLVAWAVDHIAIVG